MLIMTMVSLFISFTLTPLLCSIMLKPIAENRRGLLARMEAGFNRALDGVIGGYRKVLAFNERHRWAAIGVLLLTFLMLIHAMSLTGRIGFGMFTDPDKGTLYVKMEYPTDYDLDYAIERVNVIEERLRDVPELKHILSSVGKVEGTIGQSTEGVYLAQILLSFSQRDERTLTIEDLIDEVRARLGGYPEAIITVTPPSMIGGQDSDIELEIAGPELDTLDGLALNTQRLAEEIQGYEDIDTTVRIGKPELAIVPDRPVLADLGIPAVGLGTALRANLEGLDAGTFKQGDRNYDIVVELAEQQGKAQVERFMFPAAPGQPMLLTNLARIEERIAPIQITREDKRRVSKVFANLGPGLPLGTAVDSLGGKIDAQGNYPPGYDYKFAGMYEMMEEM
jgi:hydrophobic/amphiphilic exporter-1 (mainly G- bacteria), HAE1 family